MNRMTRIGVDVGGTKIEALVLDADGRESLRRRVATPAGDYAATVQAIHRLVADLEAELGASARVGVGMPGAVSAASGLVKNANSTVLNGRPFVADLCRALAREVREHDPALALDGGRDGLDAYRAIAPALPRLLRPLLVQRHHDRADDQRQGDRRDGEVLLPTVHCRGRPSTWSPRVRPRAASMTTRKSAVVAKPMTIAVTSSVVRIL